MQIALYCAVTRYTLFGDDEGFEPPEDESLKTIMWADVANWEVPAENIPPTEE